MPNPKKKGAASSRRHHQKQRRQKELNDQKKALYDEAGVKGQLENAALVKKALRWDTEKPIECRGKEISVKEAVYRATVAGLDSRDGRVTAAHARNALLMEQQNQKDEQIEQEAETTHNHLHIHGSLTADDQRSAIAQAIDRELNRRTDGSDRSSDGTVEPIISGDPDS